MFSPIINGTYLLVPGIIRTVFWTSRFYVAALILRRSFPHRPRGIKTWYHYLSLSVLVIVWIQTSTVFSFPGSALVLMLVLYCRVYRLVGKTFVLCALQVNHPCVIAIKPQLSTTGSAKREIKYCYSYKESLEVLFFFKKCKGHREVDW